MNSFDDWLDLARSCPCCGAQACAIYKGYYKRMFVCPELEFSGWLAIRTGLCRRTGRRFALLPDFLLPRRRLSRLATARLLECHRGFRGRLQAAIDQWQEGLNEEEYYLPRSTAWSYLKMASIQPP